MGYCLPLRASVMQQSVEAPCAARVRGLLLLPLFPVPGQQLFAAGAIGTPPAALQQRCVPLNSSSFTNCTVTNPTCGSNTLTPATLLLSPVPSLGCGCPLFGRSQYDVPCHVSRMKHNLALMSVCRAAVHFLPALQLLRSPQLPRQHHVPYKQPFRPSTPCTSGRMAF